MGRLKLVIMPKLYDAGGSIVEPWFVFYSYRNPVDGKMRRFKVYKGFSKLGKKARYALAEKIITELTADLKSGWTPYNDEQVIYDDQLQYSNVAKVYGKQKKGNITVGVYMSEFLKETEARVSPKSFESYKSKIRLFSQWLDKHGYGESDISAIREEVVLRFFNYLIYDRKLQGRTIQKYGVNLRQFFRSLLSKKKIFINPMPEMPKVANTVDHSAKPIRHDDVILLKNEIKTHDPQLWLAIQFEFYCYIRPGNELRNMRLRWIDFYAGTITIPAFENEKGIAKNRKSQTILIPKQFMEVLLVEYNLDKYSKDLYVFGPNRMPGKKTMGKNTLRNRFNSFRDRLGLSKEYQFYSWKHTGAIRASNAGVPVKDIQMQMRHHSLDVTDKYLRKMRGVDSEAIKNWQPDL